MLNDTAAPVGARDDANRDTLLAQAVNGSATSDHARITARSFRMLTERLKPKSVTGTIAIPDIKLPPRIRPLAQPVIQIQTVPEPQAPPIVAMDLQAIVAEVVHEIVPADPVEHLAAQVSAIEPLAAQPAPPLFESFEDVPPATPAMELPLFSPPEMFVPQVEQETDSAPGIEAGEIDEPVAASDDIAVEPSAVMEEGAGFSREALIEGVVELAAVPPEPELAMAELPVEFQAEPPIEADPGIDQPEISAADVAPQPQASFPDASPAETDWAEQMPEPPPDVAASEPEATLARSEVEQADNEVAVNPLTDRVVEAMIKTIADQVYSKPSASERAAFLREIADLVEKDEAQSQMVDAQAETVPLVPPGVATPPPAALTPAVEPLSVEQPQDAAAAEVPIVDAHASRVAVVPSLLRSKPGNADPFADDVSALARFEPRFTETQNADAESGDLALSLLDMMSSGSASGLPQERALAADTLLRILPRIPVKQLLAVVERVTIMETPPALLVAKLIRDPRPEVVAPLLERCMHITDQDLIAAAIEADTAKQRMIARRRVLSPVLADQLIALGDPSVVLTLIRNPGASFSHDAFHDLAEIASQHHALLAPLATRADLPPPVAFELFWFVPPELRRFIFSRFLTDSETLNKILRITLATYGEDGEQTTEMKFPPREVLDGALDHAAAFRLDDASEILAECAGVSKETALRIFADREGEPVTVILKALGYQRGRFSEAMERLRTADVPLIRPDRPVEELQTIFDSLSFNKARILLTYWDWYVRKAGPYAPRN